MALFLEQDLLVAGDALAEVVALLVGSVKRGDNDRIHTSQGGTHGLGLATQQVHIAVIDRLVETAGLGIDVHHARVVVSGIELLHDEGPQFACGAELGNLHEVNRRNAHVELDAVSHLIGGETGLGQHGHPLGTPSQGITQLLVDVGTGVVQCQRVNAERAQVGDGLHDIHQLGGHGNDVAREGLTVLEGALERVESDTAHEGVLAAVLLAELNKLLGILDSALGAAHDVDFTGGKDDALEELLQVHISTMHVEADRVDALVEHLDSLGIGGLHIVNIDVLANLPVVVVAGSADIGELTGE